MLLFSRRVPLYVSLPVTVGCGAVGYVASTWQPGPTPDPPARPNHTAVVANTTPNEPQLAPTSGTFQTGRIAHVMDKTQKYHGMGCRA
jgi:hypothetical protein